MLSEFLNTKNQNHRIKKENKICLTGISYLNMFPGLSLKLHLSGFHTWQFFVEYPLLHFLPYFLSEN